MLYQKDKDFLQDCLLYTICSQKNDCHSNSVFWEIADDLLDNDRKNSEIYQIYKWLRNETKLNGLKSIEEYNKMNMANYGESIIYPKVVELKEQLRKLHLLKIRPKMLKYEILK